MKHQRGISLLEVIVALTVISSFGAALFVWAGQTTRSANRALERMDELQIEANVDALAQSLNPSLRPEGRLETNENLIEWRSEPERAPVPHVRHPMGISPYEVATYRVRIRVLSRDGRALLLDTERHIAGFRQAHPRSSGPPGLSPFSP